MTVSLLSVQFRNLLPSEELLLFARARWNDAQARGQVSADTSDATLCITHTPSKQAGFEVKLTLAGSTLLSVSRAESPLLAVEGAFAQLGSFRELAGLELGELASGRTAEKSGLVAL